jgi:uncharacterized phage protein gp47/JayE
MSMPRSSGAVVPPPERPSNGPGLAALRYRVGTFTSFRRAMLDELTAEGTSSPLAGWKEGIDGDYQTVLLELWAYLADVLTFYQERIANEAYLPTATRRDSLQRLAGLTAYIPSPGAGASALVAFTADPSKSVDMPVGFRVGSRATPGKPAAVFETGEAITIDGALNRIPLATVQPANQFAQPGSDGTLEIVLQGTANRLSVGDYLLVVEYEGDPASETRNLRQIDQVETDTVAGTTTVTWSEPGNGFESVTLYALRVVAGPFGNNAPSWNALPPALTTTTTGATAPFPENWDDPAKASYFLANDPVAANMLYLDAVYSGIRASANNYDWAVLLTDSSDQTSGDAVNQVFQVLDARPVSRAGYAISAKVTRLTLEAPVPASVFPLRGTVILSGADALTPLETVPIAVPLAGQTLILDGVYPQLKAGGRVIVQGPDPDSGETLAEDGVIALVGPIDTANGQTTVTLRRPLDRSYDRSGTALLANVAAATHGETVRDEVLGSGDGTAFQSFALKKAPLTYLATADAETPAAVRSTLGVTVNGVLWAEKPTLAGSAADAQVYTATPDVTGATVVEFGDGFFGARPPSGQDNIRASYRKGLGQAGNVAAGDLAQLLDSRPGVQKVTNPIGAVGGAEPEGSERIRTGVPSVMQAFGRAVSAADLATLALGYPGVTKASAAWVPHEAATPSAAGRSSAAVVHPASVQPYVRLTVATDDLLSPPQQALFVQALRTYLDQRRDRNVPLRIGSFTPVYVDVDAAIDVDDRYPRQATLGAAQATLGAGLGPDGRPGFFAADRLQFGRCIHLSDLYAALQAVSGIRSAVVTSFRRPDQDSDPKTVRDVIPILPTELAVVANDPTDPAKGTLNVTWRSGGFLDT